MLLDSRPRSRLELVLILGKFQERRGGLIFRKHWGTRGMILLRDSGMDDFGNPVFSGIMAVATLGVAIVMVGDGLAKFRVSEAIDLSIRMALAL